VLAEVSNTMTGCLRPYDALGRYGGEEFLIVLPGCDGESTFKIAQRIQLSVSDRSIVSSAGPISLTMSVGTASTSDLPSASGADLIKGADTALYEAKRQGRNCVVRATQEPA
jgi:diguanylate cyclase (GGDEF)-like protein